jgi:SHS family lactate transporter-like MFS transporter
MSASRETREVTPLSRRDRFHAVTAGYLGWTMDAFDFFVVVFLVDTLAAHFGVPKKEIVWTLTATLALRPVGAVIFGLLADRYGRRVPLMANLLFFSTVEVLCGFAPSYASFLVLRALFGIGMGGEWGVGASLAMESAPRRWRGVLSGILQSGYSMGYLLAAVAARLVLPAWGWRAMFWVGGAPALLAFYVRWHVPESEAWRQKRAASVAAIAGVVRRFAPRLAYLVALMTMMMFLSHGTQDLYPDFLKIAHGIAPKTVADVAVLYNVGAIGGALVFGHLSQRLGRRLSMVCALALCLAVMPLWAFGGSLAALAGGAFLMQLGVQGAWGIIPAHLNELSPDETRGLVPGLAYQLGILFASPVNTIEYALRDRIGYGWALAAFEGAVILVLAALLWRGPEQHGKAFLDEGTEPS